MRHGQIETIAKQLGVTKQDVIDVNRWFSGDASLNAPIRADSDSGEWQDWLVDEGASQETTLAARDEYEYRRETLTSALCAQRSRAAYLRSASARRGPDHACGLGVRIRRLARARPSNRREVVRKGTEGGEKTLAQPIVSDSGDAMEMPQNESQQKSKKFIPKISDEAERERGEKVLDEAIENTFPASDPVSAEQPVNAHRFQNPSTAVAQQGGTAE
jgi:hypothetical protein